MTEKEQKLSEKEQKAYEQDIMQRNIDSVIMDRDGAYHKPRGKSLAEYEFSFIAGCTPTFGQAIWHSLLESVSAAFIWEGFPEGFREREFEMKLVNMGRVKIIEVGDQYEPVYVVPKKWNMHGDWVESTIIEPFAPRLTGKSAEKFNGVEVKNNVTGESLIRKVYPYIKAIDDALFNLEQNQSILAGKFVWLKPAGSGAVSEGSANKESENALSQWVVNGKPVKELAMGLLDDGKLPLIPLAVNDATDSFIKTVQFMMNQMLNIIHVMNNSAEGKKERMITDEIGVQHVLQGLGINGALEVREYAAKRMSKAFGLDITVSLRDGVDPFDMEDIEEDEDVSNEKE